MNRLFLLCFVLLRIPGLWAQGYPVIGTVTNAELSPLYFVNIILLKAADTTMVYGGASDEYGKFLLEGVVNGDYILRASYVGYKTLEVPFTHKGNSIMGNLVMEEQMEDLDQVFLYTKRPGLHKKADRIVFDVSNSTLSSMNSYEILKRTPGVIVINDDIRFKNEKPVIYINNKRVYLSQGELRNLLQGLNGENVQAVEVITNPPASYDAEGGVVINIATSRNLSIGYKGTVNGRLEQGVYPKYDLGTQQYYKTDKLDLFASYQFGDRKELKKDSNRTLFFDSDLPAEEWLGELNKTTKLQSHTAQLIMDTQLGTSILSISGNASLTPDRRFSNVQDTRLTELDGQPLGSFNTQSELANYNATYALNATLDQPLDKEDTHLHIAATFLNYDDEQDQSLLTSYFDKDGKPEGLTTFDTRSEQRTQIYSAQADLSGKWGVFDARTGLKYSHINNESAIVFGGFSVPDPSQDDAFTYEESIYAAYAEVSSDGEKLSMNLGFRAEYTDVAANSLVLQQLNTQNYFEWFPNLSMSYQSSENHLFALSYKRSITRPRYQTLNPYRYYINDNQYQAGNPTLTRAIANRAAVSYTFKDAYSLEASYATSRNPLESLTFQNNSMRQLYNAVYNMKEDHFYSLDFINSNNITNWWSYSLVATGFYMENVFEPIESDPDLYTMDTKGFYGSLSNAFTLDARSHFVADIRMEYISDWLFGSFKMKNRLATSVSINKSFWADQAEFSLSANDLLNSYNVENNSQYLNQDNGFRAVPETRTITVGLRFKFGNFKLRDNKRETLPSEIERLN